MRGECTLQTIESREARPVLATSGIVGHGDVNWLTRPRQAERIFASVEESAVVSTEGTGKTGSS